MKFDKKAFAFCLCGFLFTALLGAASHFFYKWSGNSPVAALFFPVNESTWEHLKLVFFPAFTYFGTGAFFMKKTPNYAAAAFFAILSAVLFIPLVFYFYTAVVGESVLAMDILVFILAVFVGYTAAYYILTARSRPALNAVSAVGLLILLALYLALTSFPPRCFLFRDPVTGGYGIV